MLIDSEIMLLMITSLLVKYGTKTQLIFYLVHLKTQNKIKISKSHLV